MGFIVGAFAVGWEKVDADLGALGGGGMGAGAGTVVSSGAGGETVVTGCGACTT
jgi:hypothetical protein